MVARSGSQEALGTLAELTAADQTLAEFVQEYWKLHAVPVLQPKTRADYRQAWGKHAHQRLGGVKLRELSPRRMSLFLAELRNDGVGEPTILKTLTMLQSVFASAVEWGALPANPVAAVRNRPSQRPTRVASPLPPTRVEAIRREVMRGTADRGSAVLISVLAYAGVRPGEVPRAPLDDVGDRTLHVTRSLALGTEKGTKTGAWRTVRLLAPLAEDLGSSAKEQAATPSFSPGAMGGCGKTMTGGTGVGASFRKQPPRKDLQERVRTTFAIPSCPCCCRKAKASSRLRGKPATRRRPVCARTRTSSMKFDRAERRPAAKSSGKLVVNSTYARCTRSRRRRRSAQARTRSATKPSAGLEPATPSLPWRCSTN